MKAGSIYNWIFFYENMLLYALCEILWRELCSPMFVAIKIKISKKL